jgi:membrane-associated phospholipid phosphatase
MSRRAVRARDDRPGQHPVRRPGRGVLTPRGGRDLARQLVIWLGFALVYETARGLARGSAAEARQHGRSVISVEQALGAFFEPGLQHRVIDASQALITAANWTYWIAQFGAVTVVLAWAYVRHTDHYIVLRNALIATNVIGYVGYVLLPTAPPRLIPGHGFVDTLAGSSSLNHGTPIVAFAANRYAAMPSLHTADAMVLGVALAAFTWNRWARWLWLLWPVWVSFSLIVTANHFWLDAAAGVLVAGLGGGIALWIDRRRAARRVTIFPAPPETSTGEGRRTT